MSDKSAIEWTEATWNTWYGCTKVSPGCANCYSERTPPYRMRGAAYRFRRGRIPLKILSDRMEVPLHWRRPRLIFVNSLSDTFHEDVPDEYLAKLFNVMAQARQHTFQVLTKRPERMREVLFNLAHNSKVLQVPFWPLPNVWLGVTAENQRMADARIPLLLETPAAVRFVSCEPLLGPLDLHRWMAYDFPSRLDWVIAGGESGGPERRRLVERCANRLGRHLHIITGCPSATFAEQLKSGVPCEGWIPTPVGISRVRSLRDQCAAAGVPFFFKQWGGPRPTSGGHLLDRRTWRAMPVAARQREAVGVQ